MYMFYLTCNYDENKQITRIFDQFSDLHQAYNGMGREGWKEERREGRKSRPREKDEERRSLNVETFRLCPAVPLRRELGIGWSWYEWEEAVVVERWIWLLSLLVGERLIWPLSLLRWPGSAVVCLVCDRR